MRTYIMSLGEYVLDVVQNDYKNPNVLVDRDDKLEFTYNAKEMNEILGGLPKSELVKFMHYITTKNMG